MPPYRTQSTDPAVDEEVDQAAAKEFEEFQAFKRAKAAGRLTVVDRPTIYACANSHFEEEKNTDPHPSGISGARTCRDCGQAMGMWPGNVEPVERNHRSGDDHR